MDNAPLPTMMRAAILQRPRTISIERVPVPQPAPDEVLVAVEAVGLCGSDAKFYTGDRPLAGPMVPGHEIAGRIAAVGANVSPQRLGERVAIEPNIPCGQCSLCQRGHERICSRKQIIGQTRWGGLAEYVTTPASFAWPIPESFTLADAATIEPTAVVVHAFRQAEVAPTATIAVVGCGGVGLLLVNVAIAQGSRVVVIEPNPVRRAAALAAGALQAIEASDVNEVHSFLEQAGVETIFECAGIAATTQLCLDTAPAGSLIMLVGLSTKDVSFNPLRFVRQEMTIHGSLIYEHPVDFASTIELVAAGKLAPGATAGQPQPLERLPVLLEAMAAGKLDAKPLIAIHG
jgi:2-desacetyl-2-hydroxyethyl bacteriochlorophyllide A dehydrogenase